jgi:hypothetical protein
VAVATKAALPAPAGGATEGEGGQGAAPPVLRLRVCAGLDRGTTLLLAPQGAAVDLGELGLGVSITFREGRPMLATTTAREVRFAGEPLGAVAVQLIRGDALRIDGVDLEVG